MKHKTTLHPGRRHGFTLIECILAGAVLVIVFTAIMAFRYHTVSAAERAENQLLAARSAYLLSEAWRGAKADEAFDPTQQDFDDGFVVESIPSVSLLDSAPADSEASKLQSQSDFKSLGRYRITVDGKEFFAQLLYRNETAVQNLRSTHVLIAWQDHRGVRHEYYLPTLSHT